MLVHVVSLLVHLIFFFDFIFLCSSSAFRSVFLLFGGDVAVLVVMDQHGSFMVGILLRVPFVVVLNPLCSQTPFWKKWTCSILTE